MSEPVVTASVPVVSLVRAGRVKVSHAMAVRRLTVSAARRVTPQIMRVTLTGSELAGFESIGPTDHVKAFFPDPATGEIAAPTLGPAGLQQPERGTAYPRDYTPRAFRPHGSSGTGGTDQAPELDLDLVLHDDGGPASRWAAGAAVGDPLVVAGPRSSKLVPEGYDSFVLGCDETALPAVARWLELLPDAATVRVLAEVSGAADEEYLGSLAPHVEVQWLRREGPPGTSGVLERAVRALGPFAPGTYVWARGEAGSIVGVRRYLRREVGLPGTQVDVGGYWRRGSADFDHHAPLDPTDPD